MIHQPWFHPPTGQDPLTYAHATRRSTARQAFDQIAKQRAAATAVLLCYLRRQLQAIALRPRSGRGLLRKRTAVVLGALALTGAVLAMPAAPARSQGARTIRVVM